MIITFFGHKTITSLDGLLEKIRQVIDYNIVPAEKTVFYCGGLGDFDNLCAKVCFGLKENNKNCEVLLITPYINVSKNNSKQYDGIIYPPLENVPLKFAISRRNMWMIDESDLVIVYVNHSFGGAYNAMKYAKRKKKRVINLGTYKD